MKLIDLFENLAITDTHIRQARGNKQNFLVKIAAKNFLKLTTRNEEVVQDIMSKCKTTDEYNEYAAKGENIIMPFLQIEDDKVTGHEGRHRAAALLCDDPNAVMTMAIKYRITDQNKKEELNDKYGPFKREYLVDFEDLPNEIYGQHGRGMINKNQDLEYVKHLHK